MKIQYCSDLHLEFPENKKFMKDNPLVPVGDILILAGDILPFALLDKRIQFFIDVSNDFEHVYWIPGNHEYYGSDIKDIKTPLNKKILKNVTLLDNKTVKINNVNFIFSTLWSKISEQNIFNIQRSVNDFKVIKSYGTNLCGLEFNLWHENSLKFIKREINKSNKKGEKCVIVTHHVPTKLNYPEVYKNSSINEAFCTELFDLIYDSNAEYWIYGHHHFNTPQFEINKTKMITNQLGYVHHKENSTFEFNKYFEI